MSLLAEMGKRDVEKSVGGYMSAKVKKQPSSSDDLGVGILCSLALAIFNVWAAGSFLHNIFKIGLEGSFLGGFIWGLIAFFCVLSLFF